MSQCVSIKLTCYGCSKGTVAEQMVYEILDPANYLLPDVNVDFTQITLEDLPPVNNTGRGSFAT